MIGTFVGIAAALDSIGPVNSGAVIGTLRIFRPAQ